MPLFMIYLMLYERAADMLKNHAAGGFPADHLRVVMQQAEALIGETVAR